MPLILVYVLPKRAHAFDFKKDVCVFTQTYKLLYYIIFIPFICVYMCKC